MDLSRQPGWVKLAVALLLCAACGLIGYGLLKLAGIA
jgi:hypothetical protein